MPPVPYPDTRVRLGQVSNILLEGNNLSFNPVPNANRYVLDITGIEIETTNTNLTLDITPGIHDISVRAYGEHDLFR